MADKSAFEIPPQIREMAEKNVEQARAAYGQFMDFLDPGHKCLAAIPTGRANGRIQGSAGQGYCLCQGEC